MFFICMFLNLVSRGGLEKIEAASFLQLYSQDGETVDDLWPLRVGWRRVQRYYDLLWQDVYDSEETWEIMESPGEISDELRAGGFM